MSSRETDSAPAARSLALLWGRTGRPSRGPKQGLTIPAVVAAAIALADADGLAALSMRKVAEKLGVGAMTLYTYVPAKAELVDLMIDAVQAERPRHEGVDGDWRVRLELVARGLWDLHQRHLWLVQAGSERTPIGPNTMDMYEVELSALAGTGLTPAEKVSVVRLVTGYVSGAARAAAQVVLEERRTGLTRDQWWARTGPLLDELIDYDRYPTVQSTGEAESHAHGPLESFEFGLQRVLDGVEMLIRSREP